MGLEFYYFYYLLLLFTITSIHRFVLFPGVPRPPRGAPGSFLRTFRKFHTKLEGSEGSREAIRFRTCLGKFRKVLRTFGKVIRKLIFGTSVGILR